MITIKVSDECSVTENFRPGEIYSVSQSQVNALIKQGAKFEIIDTQPHNWNIINRLEKK